MTLENILELVKASDAKDSKLYFLTRTIKPGVAKRSGIRDKYLFKVYQIDCIYVDDTFYVIKRLILN